MAHGVHGEPDDVGLVEVIVGRSVEVVGHVAAGFQQHDAPAGVPEFEGQGQTGGTGADHEHGLGGVGGNRRGGEVDDH